MFELKEILEATNGIQVSGKKEARARGVSINSRTLKPGELFIAIKGRKFDGHDFIASAAKKSPSAIIVSKKNIRVKKNIPVIRVDDTTKALGRLASFHRQRFSLPLVAVTGSAGKTTTKEMIAAVLGKCYNVLKNLATENNNIGTALTLLALKKSHTAVVVELGTNHPGEISWLTQIAQPTMVVLTNIGESHLEYLKSPSGVFREKFNIVRYMRSGGYIIFNNDDAYLKNIPNRKIAGKPISFGIRNAAQYQASDIHLPDNRSFDFTVNKKDVFVLPTPAFHNIYNALAAISCGSLLGVSYNEMQSALKDFSTLAGRQQYRQIGPYGVIDDTYNANPASLRSAALTLSRLNVSGKKILVCGDMLELGKQSSLCHRDVGYFIAPLDIDFLFTFGKLSKFLGQAAGRGNQHLTAYHHASIESLYKRLNNYLKPGDTILIKGSRGLHMERVVQWLEKKGRGKV